MRTTLILTSYVSVLVAIILMPAAPALGGGSDSVRFVGNSDAATLPDIGRFAMYKLCAQTFHDSRMCTSEEIVKIMDPPETTGVAWVQPVISGVALDASNQLIVVDKSSGVIGSAMPDAMSCGNWLRSANDKHGLVITTAGTFDKVGCRRTLPVACCAPMK